MPKFIAKVQRLFTRRSGNDHQGGRLVVTPGPLSLELWEAIIDQLAMLHGDEWEGSLRACSLTCKAWSPRSRHHLFRHLYLTQGRESRFLRLLSISKTNPSAYFHRLKIVGHSPFDEHPFSVKHMWVNKIFPAVTTHLVNLKELSIHFLTWDVLGEASRASILSGFQNVEIFILQGIRFTSLTQLLELIASFPSLTFLCCDDISGVDQGLPTDVIRMPAGLKSLRLGWFPKAAFIDWFLALHPVPSITTLDLIYPWEDASHVTRLLKELGPRLEHLKYGLTSIYTRSKAIVALRDHSDTEYNINLRSIQLSNAMHILPIDEVSWDPIPMILAELTSTKLEEASFNLCANTLEILGLIQWNEIDDLLSRQPNLARVLMNVIDAHETPTAEFIKARMPILASRGILLFERP